MVDERKGGVLITGGSGMIGTNITSVLLSEGYNVTHLSRLEKPGGDVKVYSWDPGKGILDPAVFTGIDHVIHLAGANIGEKRWTDNRKKELRESRIDSANLIHKVLKENNLKIKTFISASGISYYGTQTSERIYREDDPPAGDFLGNLCREWEEAADRFASEGIRTVKIRTAVTLEKNDLALKRMTFPAKFGFIGMTGNGKQYMPWIHNQDICGIYLKALMDEKMSGAYNAVAPEHASHEEFMRTLAKVLRKPFLPIPAPALALKIVYGEMAGIVLEGSRVSSEKIINAGYRFRFGCLDKALGDIYKNRENSQEGRDNHAR